MSFLKSKHNGWTWEMTRTPFMGGGGGGGQAPPTQTNVQNSNVPEYARPYVETMLGTAQQQIYNYGPDGTVSGFKPYTPYGATVDAAGNITNTAQEQANASIAPFTALQRQAQINAGSVGMPGQFNLGTGYQAFGGAGALNAGQNYNMMATDPDAQQAFMSPYMQNAVNVQKNEAFRDAQTRNLGANLSSARQGTYGGARQALAEQERNRNLQTQLGNIQAQGSQEAFKSAQQAQQFGANLGLQGYGQAVGAGTALGQMGGQQLAAQRGIIDLQSQVGGQQQGMEQQKINQAIQNYAMQQQYPMQQLAAMSGLLRGLPLQSATTQSYQAAPSAISQISGLGLTGAAAYGLMKKEGGIIKSYAEGGAVEEADGFADGGITRDVLLNPEKYSAQMIDRSTKNGVIDDIVGLAALQQKNQETKERQAAAAMAQGTPPTVKDQIIAEARQLQGIDTAQSNLPTEYAGGGIVAFSGEEGSQVRDRSGTGSAEVDTRSEFTTDVDKIKEFFAKKLPALGSAVNPFAGANTYFNKPRMTAADLADQAAGQAPKITGPIQNDPALMKPTKPRFLDDVPKDKSPAAPAAAAAAPTSPALDTSGSGIDDLIRQISGDMRTSKEASKDARKEAKLMAMLQAGLGIMGGTSQYAAANFKGAIPALQGYQEEMRGIRSDESKQIAQLAALNLKGAELKQELKKLGITKERYDSQNREDAAKIGLYGAQEDYFRRRPGTSGSAGLGGAIPPSVFDTVSQRYEGYRANPMASPVFASLPAKVQEGFKQKYKPGTQSYANLMQEYDKAAAAHMNNYLNSMSASNRKFAVE
jgi:hypothetical protein